jgi:SAM-dependent methyltransferase
MAIINRARDHSETGPTILPVRNSQNRSIGGLQRCSSPLNVLYGLLCALCALCALVAVVLPTTNTPLICVVNEAKQPTSTLDQCRNMFSAKGKGGLGEMTLETIANRTAHARSYDIWNDLKQFTGLSEEELNIRLKRTGHFHFEGEHAFWNPSTSTELAWYYATSVDYLFANAMHPADGKIDAIAKKEFEPILDYSGGVGNNVLHLASKGIKCKYFGIGMMEYDFAGYRVRKRGLEENVEFLKPFASHTDWKFDPINAPLKRDKSLGAIIAMDVLEHIPNYEKVVEAMVDSLRVGGAIVENTPFNELPKGHKEGDADTRVHVSDGGIKMSEAMGPRMKFIKEGKIWKKISD